MVEKALVLDRPVTTTKDRLLAMQERYDDEFDDNDSYHAQEERDKLGDEEGDELAAMPTYRGRGRGGRGRPFGRGRGAGASRARGRKNTTNATATNTTQNGTDREGNQRKCFNCDSTAHLARECPTKAGN